jgi:hypothetical protein
MDLTWVKSSYSANSGDCVEVARNMPGTVAVRDSKDPHGPVLRVTASDWRRLVARVKTGH